MMPLEEIICGACGVIDLIQALTAALDAKSSYTRGHSDRVATIAWSLSRSLGLGDREAESARLAGQLHDIGKIGVSDAIISKPGKLTLAEFSEMRRHPEIGASIVEQVRPLRILAPAVRGHHERWDGSGYPDGLRGEEIPLTARILCIADSFDAMTSSRPYREVMDGTSAAEEILHCAGSQFDPLLAESFARFYASGELQLSAPIDKAATAEGLLLDALPVG